MVANHEAEEDPTLDFCLEVFAHATLFLGIKFYYLESLIAKD